MFDEWGTIMEEVRKLNDDQRGPFITYLVVSGIRDIAYYGFFAIVAWALGRRLIQAIMAATREASRDRA
ncbi:MAG TPA: hypothetical protein VGR35_16130 [Tepidisphaeraceae bacterium]|nr:hypothetical protein [Tepidisphaeraceae bacterium]